MWLREMFRSASNVCRLDTLGGVTSRKLDLRFLSVRPPIPVTGLMAAVVAVVSP